MTLGERVSHLESGALVVCFIVVTFVGVVTSGLFSDHSEHENHFSVAHILLCCVSVVGFAVINVIGRLLKGIHFTVLCTAQFTLNVVFSLIVVICCGGLTHSIYIFDSMWLALIALGASRTFSTQLFVRATQIAKSQRIASLNYCQALFGYTVDFLFYGYILSGIEILAVIVIVSTGAVVFIQTRRDHLVTSHCTGARLDDRRDLEQPLINK
jgi:drug/metabolite transporter (DMT)-like permease